MENVIIWKDINEVQPEEGQDILYSYAYQNWSGTWEYKILIGTYTRNCRNAYPMSGMTHWTELPEPVKHKEED